MEHILQDILSNGVAGFVLKTINLAYDADAKHCWRGKQDHALSRLEPLSPACMHGILSDLIDASDPSAWLASPHWFTTREDFGVAQLWMRALAARQLPIFIPSGVVDASLLEDRDRLVRLYTAMHCAAAGYPATEALIAALQDGVVGDRQAWLSNDGDAGWGGDEAALEMLLKIAPGLPWVQEKCREFIREHVAARTKLSAHGREPVDRRIALSQALGLVEEV